jgi:hypothetical protein
VEDEEQNQKTKQSQTNAAPGGPYNDGNLNDDENLNIGIGVGVVATADGSFNAGSPRESALPSGGNSVDIENGGIASAEIEAFVADNVVDATGVAVVMSEVEEERLERKKHRRYFMYGIACFILVAVAIVLAVVFTVDT